MAKANIRNKIKEIAKGSFISATEEFCEQAEIELEKTITPEFLEKVRGELVKRTKIPTPSEKKTPGKEA